MTDPPVVYILCGFVGSGKTTYARRLEARGVVRLSIDERVFHQHGRHGVDYPEHEYPVHADAATDELDNRLSELLTEGRPVVLDYGLWSKEDRDWYKRLAEKHGARWKLLYFRADSRLLRRRLEERNRRTDGDPNALRVENRHFAEFLTRFDPPSGEGEDIVEQV